MPKQKPYLTVYLSVDDYELINQKAVKARLSLSAFARRVCLAQEVNSLIDLEAMLLVKNSKADLGRLGGLLKKYLSETGGTEDCTRSLEGFCEASNTPNASWLRTAKG